MPNGKQKKSGQKESWEKTGVHRLHPETKRSIWAIVLLGIAAILLLAQWGNAGPAGALIYKAMSAFLGVGYILPPLVLTFGAIALLLGRTRLVRTTLIGVGLLILSVLALIDIAASGKGGQLGLVLGALKIPFGQITAAVINSALALISILIILNFPLKLARGKKPMVVTGGEEDDVEKLGAEEKTGDIEEKPEEKKETRNPGKEKLASEDGEKISPEMARYGDVPLAAKAKKSPFKKFENYTPPPLSLLKSIGEKPTTGDLITNANVIKRTLDSFGIPVDMGEINIGPAVTRYTLKPAEGVKLSRITALNQDLALVLAAHPIRIEAPIPGKSLVGIEVPNKAAALVRLGSLMNYPEFEKSGPLGFVLGRDVSGEPVFADIERMPHLLVAGATGSGKSILIHTLLLSLLYKNSPATLKLVLIDPKRVELSTYARLPHLVSPVVTESKKAVGVFRWAIGEMDRRYELLLQAGSRDIKSYNANAEEPLPYVLIVIDELADLMSSFGREVEGSIVRLAQMARATGIHLVLSTQRPSVEVITGLIKANITSRIALQVASQIDSRTILDAAGAEKLLGRGDMLFISSDISKPKRIQSGYVTEEEINKVADYIRENNESVHEAEQTFENQKNGSAGGETGEQNVFDEYLDEGDDDDLYDEAVRVVGEAQKASASLLQRRLKVGYARAARLLDIMEAKGVVGPGEGAKPREVFAEKPGEQTDGII